MSNRLEDLEIYNLSQIFGEEIWELVTKWDYFAKDTIGQTTCKIYGFYSSQYF